MSDLHDAMPLLACQEGIWEGWYRYYDPDGNKIDEHRSRLVCRFPKDGPVPYHQSNHYFWDDGRKEVREFPATYARGRLWFDNDLITGWAAEDKLDEHNRTLMLHWLRKGEPETYLYEKIQVSDCRKYRTRVWQWINAGRIRMRTLIDEHKVSDSWEGY
jgi:hypothetical protein